MYSAGLRSESSVGIRMLEGIETNLQHRRVRVNVHIFYFQYCQHLPVEVELLILQWTFWLQDRHVDLLAITVNWNTEVLP